MRLVIGALVCLAVGLVVGYFMIPLLRRAKFGQEIREEGPKSHQKKQGTPTMGGVLFMIAVPIGMLVGGAFSEAGVFLFASALLFGLIGFLDDGLKIFLRRSEGLTPKQKLLLQFVASLILLLWARMATGYQFSFWLPLVNIVWPAGVLGGAAMVFIMLGTTNACNLTDGLDGLLSSVSVTVFLGYAIIAAVQKDDAAFAFAIMMFVAMIAFLLYNRHPAQVFMGDVGSFFIGGAVVGLAMMTKTELLLPLICLVYMSEAVSDIIQVLVYKKTRRRFFRMAPLHHHFELGGLHESRVVLLFTAVSAGCVLLALLVYALSGGSVVMNLKG